MRTTAPLLALVIAAEALTGCGGARHHQVGVVRQAGLCGDALAKVMRRQFIDPSSTVAIRLRARRTLDLIAAHAASVVPVCASRASLQR